MGAALKFRQETQLARQAGELGRLKVVRGPDIGATFVITGRRVSIGRGDENDVILSDLRASRKHCELVLENGSWTVRDAGSVNGIMISGKHSRGGAIRTRDTIEVGESVLEFVGAEAGTLMLVSPPGDARQIEADRLNMDVQRARIHAMSRMGGLAKNVPRVDKLGPALDRRNPGVARPAPASAQSDPKKLLLIGAAVLIGGYLFLSDDPTPPKNPKDKAADSERDR